MDGFSSATLIIILLNINLVSTIGMIDLEDELKIKLKCLYLFRWFSRRHKVQRRENPSGEKMQSAWQWISFLSNKTINCVTHLHVWLCLMALPFENMQTKKWNCVTEWKRVDVGPFRSCTLGIAYAKAFKSSVYFRIDLFMAIFY